VRRTAAAERVQSAQGSREYSLAHCAALSLSARNPPPRSFSDAMHSVHTHTMCPWRHPALLPTPLQSRWAQGHRHMRPLMRSRSSHCTWHTNRIVHTYVHMQLTLMPSHTTHGVCTLPGATACMQSYTWRPACPPSHSQTCMCTL
jgi:hypothetical protein